MSACRLGKFGARKLLCNLYWGLTFTAEQPNSTISMTKGSYAPTLSLVTSVNYGKTWETFTPGETTITLAKKGSSVWFAAGEGGNTQTASNNTNSSYSNIFAMTGSISASGSVMSLLNASEPTYECGSLYTFTRLFDNCTSLTTAPELPAETLASNCYQYMFQGCTSLTTAPALPAETLATYCYYYMFRGCTSLTAAPSLPATTLASNCYRQMFNGCTSLTSAPALPAETLAGNCYYQMFYGCTALTSAPELPATTIAGGCYRQMFDGCTSLTQTPDLPATTANALTYVYYRMFYNCTGLECTGRIAIATATGISALAQMFYGCSNLTYIELSGVTAWSTKMSNWVSGVSATGTFKCPAALGTDATITRGVSNCPTGWTVVNT